ncbi:MAG: 50S ribosomal protein L11 methyltransferase [Thermodesulfobacteriota bacterium]
MEVHVGKRGREGVVELLVASGSPGVVDKDTSVTAYLPVDDGGEKRYRKLMETLQRSGFHAVSRPFQEHDWTSRWKRFIKSVAITRGLLIKPTWEEVKPRSGRIVVEIDPGMAFGTGHHPSTGMCLKALEKLVSERRIGEMLDVGTGAGILAIAARKLGVARVVGIDTDVTALKVARRNVRQNRVAVTISGTPLEKVRGRFSLVAANIIAEELVRIAPSLVKRIAPDGFLILSGILKEREDEVVEQYRSMGLKRYRTFRRGEWVCLVYRGGV